MANKKENKENKKQKEDAKQNLEEIDKNKQRKKQKSAKEEEKQPVRETEESKKRQKQSKKIEKAEKIKTKGNNKDSTQNEKTEIKIDENDPKRDSDSYENISIMDLKTIVLVLFILAIFAVALWQFYSKEIAIPSNQLLDESIEMYADSKINSNVRKNNLPDFNVESSVNLLLDYLNERSIIYANPKKYLIENGFTTQKKIDLYDKTTDETFIKTDILYDNIKNNLLTYLSQNFFMREFKDIFKNSNSLIHVANIEKEREIYSITKSEQIQKGGMPVVKVWYKTRIEKRRRIRRKDNASSI